MDQLVLPTRHMMSMLLPVAESKSDRTPCARVSMATKAMALDIMEIVLMVFLAEKFSLIDFSQRDWRKQTIPTTNQLGIPN